MPITKDKLLNPMKMPYSCIFYDPSQSVRILPRRYFQSMDIVHKHDFFELVLVKSGTGIHVTENGDYNVKRGDIFLIRPGCLHCYQDIHKLEIINILYQPALLSLAELRNDPGFLLFFETKRGSYDARLSFNIEEMCRANKLIEDMLYEQNQKHANFKFALKTILMQLILLITRALAERDINEIEEIYRFRDLLAYMDQHLADSLKVTDFAHKAGMSVRSLERTFRKLTDHSPWAYFTGLRLEAGSRLLLESDLTISQIANEIGLVDNGHFAKLFRDKFGCLPSKYRQKAIELD